MPFGLLFNGMVNCCANENCFAYTCLPELSVTVMSTLFFIAPKSAVNKPLGEGLGCILNVEVVVAFSVSALLFVVVKAS